MWKLVIDYGDNQYGYYLSDNLIDCLQFSFHDPLQGVPLGIYKGETLVVFFHDCDMRRR